jgi:hypothetical protein
VDPRWEPEPTGGGEPAVRGSGGWLTTDLGARATGTSHLSPVPSFTTVTVSPVTWATQRAAESAMA